MTSPLLPMDLQAIFETLRADISAMTSPWLKKSEAAKYIRVCPSTINRLWDKGAIKRYYLDGATGEPRCKREELDAIMTTEPKKQEAAV